MSDREPVLRDCFKVKKGLCVTGDAFITGNLTLSGDFAWLNPDALLTVGNIETINLSAGRLYSSNDELVVVPFGPDYTILHPLSVVDETVFESAVQMETDLWVKGNLRVDGNAYLSAGIDGVINVGDTNTDNVVFNADIQSSLIPNTTDTYDLGSVDQHWDTLYVHDISAHGSVDIEDNLFVSGTTTLSGALSAGSDATLSSNLTVSANTTIGGTTTLSGALSAGSDVEIDGILDVELDATLSSNLTVSADTTIGGTTTLSGTFSAAGDSKIDSDLHVVGDLRVDGDVWFNANNTNGTNTINLGDDNTDNVVFNADIDSDIIPDKTLTNTLGISSQQWLELFVQDISATGDVTISDTLNVSGDTNIVGDISATGIGVFDDDVHIKGDLRVDGNAYLSAGSSGSINIGDTNTDNIVFVADVSSNILPDESDKYDLGSATQQWRELFVKDISATGDLTSTGTLTVSSDTIIGGTTTLSGTLSTVSDAKFDEDVHIVGDLRVDGDVWFNANNTGGTNTINLGDDNTDNVVFNADVDSNIIPDDNITFDLGSATQQWRELHTQDVSISRDLSSNRHVNFPNLSAGGLSGNFVSIQSDGELTTSSISVDAIKQVGTVVNTTSANWNNVYTDVSETSAEWDSVYSSVCATSAEWDSVYSYVNDTSATNNLTYNDTRFVNVTGDTMTGDLDLGTNKIITRNVTTGIDSGVLTLAGGTNQSDGAQIQLFGDNNTNPDRNNRAQINADNIFIGDVFAGGSFQPWMLHVDVDNEQIILGGLSPLNNSDVSVYGTTTVSGDVLPNTDVDYDLGSSTHQWNTIYTQDVSASGDVHVVGDLRVDGDVWFNANNTGGTNTINLGDDNTDNVVFNADVDSDIIPDQNMTYDLGSVNQHWSTLYVHDVSAHGSVSASDLYVTGSATLSSLSLSGDSSTPVLRVAQLGSGNALEILDQSDPDNSPFIIDATGKVGIGLTPNTSKFEVSGSSVFKRASTGTQPSIVHIENTATGPTANTALTVVGDISASGDIYAANNSIIFSDGSPENDVTWSRSNAVTAKRVAEEWDAVHNNGVLTVPVSSQVKGPLVVDADVTASTVNVEQVYFRPEIEAGGSSPAIASSFVEARSLTYADVLSSRDTTSIVQANSADWADHAPTERIQVLTRSSLNLTFESGQGQNVANYPEFITVATDNSAGDSKWDDITYAHAMALPYNTTVKKIILRGTATQSATVNIGIHTNNGVTDPNSIEYKYFTQAPTATAENTYQFNNESKVFTFADTTSALEGETLGISISGTKPISTTNLSIVLEYSD